MNVKVSTIDTNQLMVLFRLLSKCWQLSPIHWQLGVTTPASYETVILKTVVTSVGSSGIGVLSAAQL